MMTEQLFKKEEMLTPIPMNLKNILVMVKKLLKLDQGLVNYQII